MSAIPVLPASQGPQPSDPLKALVVVNPVSPHTDLARVRQALEVAFAARGGRFEVFETPAEAPEAALDRALARARSEEMNLAIAAGGDGTVSMVANRMAAAAPGMLLAIIPLGTANVLARELLIPLDIETAVTVAAERRRVVDLDAIEFDGRRFFTQVGVGLDARIIGETSREAQQKLGRLAYFETFLRALRGHHASHFTIHVDERRHLRVRAWQVVVANAATFGLQPFTWGPDIDPTDGVLDVCVYDVRSPLDSVRIVWRVLTGRHRNDEPMRFLAVRETVRIESPRPLTVQGDGELIGTTPVTLRRVSGAVSVVVPEAVEDVTAADAPEEENAPGRPFASAGQVPETRLAQARVRANPERRRVLARLGQHVLVHRIATFGAIDAALFLRMNSMPGGKTLDRVMSAASRAMDLGEGWVVVALLTAMLDRSLGWWMPVEVTAALWLTMWTVNHPLKALFCRDRPFLAYVKARVVGRKPSDSSFPSGHTAAAFAGATLLTPHLTWLSPTFFAYAVLVGVSRVYLGVHYPSDVAIGAVAGVLLAAAYRALLGLVLPGS